jgi:hypothetical protein
MLLFQKFWSNGMIKQLFFFLFFLTVSLEAVITISPVNIGEKPGFSGSLKGSFETKRGNSDVDNYAAGIRGQYDNNTTYVLWADFTFSYGKASGETNTNKTYSHIRYIHTMEIQKEFNYELFAQSEMNEFTMVKKRFLSGGGLRYHMQDDVYGNLYFGLGAFYEHIAYTTQIDPNEANLRVNSYIAYTKRFNKESKLSYVGYYQPNINKSIDYILSNGLEVEVLVYKKLYLNFVLYYDIDTQPAIGVKKEDISQKTSFIYKF